MEFLKNEKRFRYLNALIKYLTKIKEEHIVTEDDMIDFEIKFHHGYYYLKYKFRW